MNIPILAALTVGVFLLVRYADKKTGQLLDFSSLVDAGYDPNDINRLNNLYSAMYNAGLSADQIKFMLAQSLHETGLLTGAANYHLMDDFNNYAGITGNSRYPRGNNSAYADYPTISDFVSDWITVLGFGTQPINATTLTDFNNRLAKNGYYTDNPATYLADMQRYYNLLNSI